MRKNAFTLVELLGVIVILGIIGMITVPLVQRIVIENTEKAYNEQVASFEKAAKNWANSNIYGLNKCDTDTCENLDRVTLKTLKDEGFLENRDIKNPKTDEIFDGIVIIDLKDGKYKFKYQEDLPPINGIVYRWTTDRLNIGDSIEGISTVTDYKALGKKYFLKHEIVDNKIQTSEACLIKDGNTYCLKTNEYETSKTKLLEIFGEGACNVTDSFVHCHESRWWRANATSSGYVAAHVGASYCGVYSDGNSHCYE